MESRDDRAEQSPKPSESLASEAKPSTGSTDTVLTRRALKKRRQRRAFLKWGSLGGSVLLLAGAGGYFALGSATVPEAQASYAELSEDDPCEDFASIGATCTVSFDYSDSVARDGLISQLPEAGFSLTKPAAIELVYSMGPKESEFPSLERRNYDEVLAELYLIGVEVGEVTVVENEDLGANRIVTSSIEAGSTVENGSIVDLEVSAETVDLPELKGLTREQAELDLQRLGFELEIVEEDSTEPVGTVISQDPAAGAVAKGSSVVVKIAKAGEVQNLQVPTVVGLTEDEAQGIIAAAGFKNIALVRVESSKVAEPRVSHVAPGEGRTVRSDSNVVIVVTVPETEPTP